MTKIAMPVPQLTDHAADRWRTRFFEDTGFDLDDAVLEGIFDRIRRVRTATGTSLQQLQLAVALGAVMTRVQKNSSREIWAIRMGDHWAYFVIDGFAIITVLPKRSRAAKAFGQYRRPGGDNPRQDAQSFDFARCEW